MDDGWGRRLSHARRGFGRGIAHGLEHAQGAVQALFGGGMEEVGGHAVLAGHAAPIGVHPAQVVLGDGVALKGALAIEFGRFFEVTRHAFAMLKCNRLQAQGLGVAFVLGLRPRRRRREGRDQPNSGKKKAHEDQYRSFTRACLALYQSATVPSLAAASRKQASVVSQLRQASVMDTP